MKRVILALLISVVVFTPVTASRALTNGLALAPPMGWNDWNTFGCGISDAVVRQTADAMATNGMKDAGYEFVNIDDCWASGRDSNGVVLVNAGKFPNGIKAVADYVHSKGLKLGLYTDHGTNTCSSSNPPGSYGHEYVDAMTYASWGVDYLKNDSCKLPVGDAPKDDYFRMADGLMKSGRSIVTSLCPNAAHYEYWSPDEGNLWRTTGDIKNTFSSMVGKIDQNSKSAYVAGPGRWNDPDMLEVGNGEFTNGINAQSHFTMWCIMAAPLIAGNDIRAAAPQTLAILTNAEAIAVDQDPAGEQAVRVGGIADVAEVWSKPLGYDFAVRAVALFNRTAVATNITCYWTNLALQSGPAAVRDLWAHADLGLFAGSFTTNVPAQGAVLLKIVGTPMPPPAPGTNYLSDLPPIYAYTGYGTLVRDKSIGGNTLTLDGATYSKGIGTHAIGGHEFNLGGIASRFRSDIGVDDEVGTNGSVIFQVFADGTKIYDSGIMTGGSPKKTIDLDVTGVRRLTLGVTDTGNDVTGNRNSNDHSDWANALVIVTNTSPQLPRAPTGLAASRGGAITLSWDTALAAISYDVKRATASGGPYTTIASVAVPGFTDADVTPGATNFYVVSAASSFGESSNSLEVSAAPCSVPAVPAVVAATVSNLAVSLAWSPSSGAASYTVARFTGNTPPAVIAGGLAATNFTDTNVVRGVIYYYTVTAANSCNQSAPSGFVAAAMPPVPSSLPIWTGGSAVDNNWSDAANWGGTNIAAGSTLFFNGATRLNNTNDTPAGTFYSGIAFNPASGPFVLNGNSTTMGGSITNNSSNQQAVNLGVNFTNSIVLNGAAAPLVIGRGLTNTFGGSGSLTVTLAGAGILTNLLSSASTPGGTNIIATTGNANWTLVNNSSSAPITVPWAISINSGAFSFGSASSAPVLVTTTPNNSPSDNQAGTVSGATGTFNMVAGTLTTSSRLNTATALNSTGIVNQVGGTFNLGSQFQGANGGNTGEVSIANLSGGTMNIAGGGGAFYVASRGSGTLTVSGSAALNCGTLDVSRNASGNTFGSIGVVNLNGGTILASKVGTATANSQTGTSNNPVPAATFYFNGGTLKLNSSATPFFQGSTVAPIIPISAIVKSGGAIIDTNGKTNIFAEPLLHDDDLGAAPDGGLTKNGPGSLILVPNVAYTGNTVVNAGALVLSNSVTLGASPVVSVASGATLDAGGRADQTLALIGGQKLTGGGTVNGNVTVGAGAVLSPGNLTGPLTFNNNLTLYNGSVTIMEIDKSAATNDVLHVNGRLAYGGTLVAANVGTSPFKAGDKLALFNAANFTGRFAGIAPSMPGSGLAWDASSLASNGVLLVVAAAPPRLTTSTVKGTNLVLSASMGIPNAPCYVLTSSNLTLPLSNWTRLATNLFDSTGAFAFTNAVDSTSPPRFYLLQLP
jgi:alpha-galactosidase